MAEASERRLRSGLAVVLAVSICMVGAVALLFGSGALRYANELVVNVIYLAFLTLAFGAVGIVLMLTAVASVWTRRPSSARIAFGLCGIVVAVAAAVALSIAAGCTPQCSGMRGSMTLGVILAIPAGFAAGIASQGIWFMSRQIVRAHDV
jgi:hypothetical protein